ncbi:hypothetical protein PTKU64_88580 [Paraburkholderia terrae]|uniref:Uncharacterized protein n=1 Tax=Paraburkholderia terrae TaxID=311230 RepID=A0ABM7U1F1_9BURK|nr:hypothetical protein PTKU64_88580 [Paraburkholderia terrae]
MKVEHGTKEKERRAALVGKAGLGVSERSLKRTTHNGQPGELRGRGSAAPKVPRIRKSAPSAEISIRSSGVPVDNG